MVVIGVGHGKSAQKKKARIAIHNHQPANVERSKVTGEDQIRQFQKP